VTFHRLLARCLIAGLAFGGFVAVPVVTSDEAQAAESCVTRSEYGQVKKGFTKSRVHSIFDTSGTVCSPTLVCRETRHGNTGCAAPGRGLPATPGCRCNTTTTPRMVDHCASFTSSITDRPFDASLPTMDRADGRGVGKWRARSDRPELSLGPRAVGEHRGALGCAYLRLCRDAGAPMPSTDLRFGPSMRRSAALA